MKNLINLIQDLFYNIGPIEKRKFNRKFLKTVCILLDSKSITC